MKKLTWFRWLTSPGKRGDITLVKGGVYNNDKLTKPIDPASAIDWEENGHLERVKDAQGTPFKKPKVTPVPSTEAELENEGKTPPEEAEEPKSEETDEDDESMESEEEQVITADSNEMVKVKELEIDDLKPEEKTKMESKPVTSYPKDAHKFPCTHTADCPRAKKPYKRYWDFREHMEKVHDEPWNVEGDLIVKEA